MAGEAADLVRRPFCPVAAKRMYGPSSGQNFSTVRGTTRDEIFVSCVEGDAFSINDQGVATLYDEHVFVVIVYVRR